MCLFLFRIVKITFWITLVKDNSLIKKQYLTNFWLCSWSYITIRNTITTIGIQQLLLDVDKNVFLVVLENEIGY